MKVRIRFTKTGKIRWTSHRDVARMWERAFRRAELPLAYSSGFSPRPKVSFGLALSTGHESLAEYLDLELDADRAASIDVAALPVALSAALPPGLSVVAAAPVGAGAPSLQHEVTSCGYDIVVAGCTAEAVTAMAAATMAAPSVAVTRVRKGRTVNEDVRSAILDLEVLGPSIVEGERSGVRLTAELATQPRGLRPAELLLALTASPGPGVALEEVRVCRTHQWISRADGAREEPLALPHVAVDVAPPAPQLERVS